MGKDDRFDGWSGVDGSEFCVRAAPRAVHNCSGVSVGGREGIVVLVLGGEGGDFGDCGEDEVSDGGSSLIDQHGCKERRDWHAGSENIFCCVGTGVQIGGLIRTCDGGENVPCGDCMVY